DYFCSSYAGSNTFLF
nr:immunoglobulin light chain junction region [Macaca mulatta]MOW67831.1 immunoglobulin light chain junction region [Macaca mulatta]